MKSVRVAMAQILPEYINKDGTLDKACRVVKRISEDVLSSKRLEEKLKNYDLRLRKIEEIVEKLIKNLSEGKV